MIGYKIVERGRNGDFRSLYIRARGETRYAPNKKTVPNPDCGNLLVFNTLRDAQSFFRDEGLSSLQCALFQCEYEPAPKNLAWNMTVYYDRAPLRRTEFWGIAPVGSRRAESVTLLEEVDTW